MTKNESLNHTISQKNIAKSRDQSLKKRKHSEPRRKEVFKKFEKVFCFCVLYPCDEQGHCNRVLDLFPGNNFCHKMVNLGKLNFKSCSIS